MTCLFRNKQFIYCLFTEVNLKFKFSTNTFYVKSKFIYFVQKIFASNSLLATS